MEETRRSRQRHDHAAHRRRGSVLHQQLRAWPSTATTSGSRLLGPDGMLLSETGAARDAALRRAGSETGQPYEFFFIGAVPGCLRGTDRRLRRRDRAGRRARGRDSRTGARARAGRNGVSFPARGARRACGRGVVMYDDRGCSSMGWRPSEGARDAPRLQPCHRTAAGRRAMGQHRDTASALDAAARHGRAAGAWQFRPGRCAAPRGRRHDRPRRRGCAPHLEDRPPIAQSQREWALSTDQMRWYAEEARRIYGRVVESACPAAGSRCCTSRWASSPPSPRGTFPAVLMARKLAPALAAGCAAILRPTKRPPAAR